MDSKPGPFGYPSASSFFVGTPNNIDVYFGDIIFPVDFGPGTGVGGDGNGEPFGAFKSSLASVLKSGAAG